MVKIKICGVTNVSDALQAAELGADAVGLNFYAGSPRHVTREMAAKIVRALPPFIEPVAVFVNEPDQHVKKIVHELGLRSIQWHGDRLLPTKDHNLNDFRKFIRWDSTTTTRNPLFLMWHAPTVAEKKAMEESLKRMERMIDAMTEEERTDPDNISSSRRQEIAFASGTHASEVKQLLTHFKKVRIQMRQNAALTTWQRLKMMVGGLGPADEIQQAAAALGISGLIFPIDFHPMRVTQAFGVRDEESLELVKAYLEVCTFRGQLPAAILVDAHVPGSHGGTGQTLPWELLADFSPGVPLILAGGLTSENVAQAIRLVRPYAVDVASGVECSPGKKDVDKMKKFIDAVRLAV